MSGVINYLYDPNQQVWVIIPCSATNTSPLVKEGKVIRVRGDVLTTGTEVKYDVQVEGDVGTTEILEADIFSTLALATDEYEIRLT